jgi:hypothetical protein
MMLLPAHMPHSVPQVSDTISALPIVLDSVLLCQILINKTPVTHINPDVCAASFYFLILSHCGCQIILLGDADGIIEHICEKLGWTLPPAKAGQYLRGPLPVLMKRRSQECESPTPKRVADRYVDYQCVLVYCSQCVPPQVIFGFSRVLKAENGCPILRRHRHCRLVRRPTRHYPRRQRR